MRHICYNQPIYEDNCLELDEYAGLTLGVIDNNNVLTTVVEPMNDQASILILDNDSEFVLMTLNACGDVAWSDLVNPFIPSGCGGSGADILLYFRE